MPVQPPETRQPADVWNADIDRLVLPELARVVERPGATRRMRRTTPLTSDVARRRCKEVRRCPNPSW